MPHSRKKKYHPGAQHHWTNAVKMLAGAFLYLGREAFVFPVDGLCRFHLFLFVGAKFWMYAAFQSFFVFLFSLHVIPLTGSPIVGVYRLHLGQVRKVASVEYCGLFNQSPVFGPLDCFTFLGPSLQLCGPGVPFPWGAVCFQPPPPTRKGLLSSGPLQRLFLLRVLLLYLVNVPP